MISILRIDHSDVQCLGAFSRNSWVEGCLQFLKVDFVVGTSAGKRFRYLGRKQLC